MLREDMTAVVVDFGLARVMSGMQLPSISALLFFISISFFCHVVDIVHVHSPCPISQASSFIIAVLLSVARRCLAGASPLMNS